MLSKSEKKMWATLLQRMKQSSENLYQVQLTTTTTVVQSEHA